MKIRSFSLRLYAFLLTVIVAASLMQSCAPKAKEIPMESFVDIWFKIQSDQAFRQKYPDPVKAPDQELNPFTQPLGFTAADFRHTRTLIDRDDMMKKEFQAARDKMIDKLALETLNELQDKDSLANKP